MLRRYNGGRSANYICRWPVWRLALRVVGARR